MTKDLALIVQEVFLEKGLTLALGESCTGGRIAARLTAIPGSSVYFLGSIVSYANQLKVDVLKVDPFILEKYGAVSKEVVLEMAAGVLAVTGADVSAAISGIAGPGGAVPGKPVGTIWIAISARGGIPFSCCLQLRGSRIEIMDQAVELTLHKLIQLMEDNFSSARFC
jgi:PncC family amidohydrolase